MFSRVTSKTLTLTNKSSCPYSEDCCTLLQFHCNYVVSRAEKCLKLWIKKRKRKNKSLLLFSRVIRI